MEFHFAYKNFENLILILASTYNISSVYSQIASLKKVVQVSLYPQKMWIWAHGKE